MIRSIRALAVPVALLLVGAACGGSDDEGSGSATNNEADVSFVTGMIPHHEQAIVMSSYASEQAASADVKRIADEISANQDPEIEQMKGFLDDWGVAEPQGGEHGEGGAMEGGGVGGGHPGMLDDEQLQSLQSAQGADFDRLFAQQMIRHHQGAITASEKELADGQSPEAKELAQTIIDQQKKEIAELEQVLTAT